MSARTGLLHVLNGAINGHYVSGWYVVARELRRIVRAPIQNYDLRSVASIEQAQRDAEVYIEELSWERVYDFCERLYRDLTQSTEYGMPGEEVTITKAQSQLFIAEEVQRLLEEEGLGYEFRDGLVQRRGKRHTVNQINKAERALADLRLEAARKHFSKALRHFREREKPDHENAVKEYSFGQRHSSIRFRAVLKCRYEH